MTSRRTAVYRYRGISSNRLLCYRLALLLGCYSISIGRIAALARCGILPLTAASVVCRSVCLHRNYQPITLLEAKSTVFGSPLFPPIQQSLSRRKVPPLSRFNYKPASVIEVVSLLQNTPTMTCELDPISTCMVTHATGFSHRTSRLCTLSLECGVFPARFKKARVLPLLKKPSFDPDKTSSY